MFLCDWLNILTNKKQLENNYKKYFLNVYYWIHRIKIWFLTSFKIAPLLYPVDLFIMYA